MYFLGMFLELDRKPKQGRGARHCPGARTRENDFGFRRKRLSAGFQPLGLEMGRVCLGEELHSRDGKGVTKNTDDEAE